MASCGCLQIKLCILLINVWICVVVGQSPCPEQVKMAPRRVIIDCDMGIDDYTAVLALLGAETSGHVKIEAITAVHGNTGVDNVVRNVVRLLEVAGRTDIPVYRGCHEKLIPGGIPNDDFYGKDGFEDLTYSHQPDLRVVQKQPAVWGLNEIVSKNPNEISLICLGALTNVAVTAKIYQGFISQIKDVWIMGGNYQGVGNIRDAAEFNFYMDPEAASIVLSSLKCQMYMLPWEVALKIEIPMSWRLDILGGVHSPAMDLLNKAVIKHNQEHPAKSKIWSEVDSLLAAIYLDPNIITDASNENASVELCGTLTRGEVIIDHKHKFMPNIVLIKNYDEERYKNVLLETARNLQ